MFDPEPSKVLKCLHNFGYGNIPQKKFDLFMSDMKRLIKYDQKHGDPGGIFKIVNPSKRLSKKTNSRYKHPFAITIIKTPDSPPSIKKCHLRPTTMTVNKSKDLKQSRILNEIKEESLYLDKSNPVKFYKKYQEQMSKHKFP